MLHALHPERPCSLEDAVRHLRGITHLLAHDANRADDLVEAALENLLTCDTAIDPDAVDLKLLFKPIRRALSTLQPPQRDTGAVASDLLPYLLRESLVLHRGAGISLPSVAVLLDEPAGIIRQRIKEADRLICSHCPAFFNGPIAA
ncbi:MAG: hypothetical protein ACK4Y9_03365 [Hyphomonas sp.]